MADQLTPAANNWLRKFDDWIMLPVVQCPDHGGLLEPIFVGMSLTERPKILMACIRGDHRFEWENVR